MNNLPTWFIILGCVIAVPVGVILVAHCYGQFRPPRNRPPRKRRP